MKKKIMTVNEVKKKEATGGKGGGWRQHTHIPGVLFEAVQHGDDGVWWQLLTLCLRLVLAHPHQLWTSALQETHARRDEGLLHHRNTTNSLTFQELCMLIYASKILFLLS